MHGLFHNVETPDIETSSDSYRRRFSGEVGAFFLDEQRHGAAKLLAGLPSSSRVLDVGGGHGQLTEFLLKAGHRVCVHGSASSCLERVRSDTVACDSRPQPAVSNLWRLPFRDGSFDLVTAVRVLAHVVRWRAFIDELTRVSRRAVLVDYAPWSSANVLAPILFHVKHRIEGNTRPFFCYTGSSLAGAFRRNGFARVKTHKQFWAPMGVHRMMGSGSLSSGIERVGRSVGLTRLIGSPVLMLAERE